MKLPWGVVVLGLFRHILARPNFRTFPVLDNTGNSLIPVRHLRSPGCCFVDIFCAVGCVDGGGYRLGSRLSSFSKRASQVEGSIRDPRLSSAVKDLLNVIYNTFVTEEMHIVNSSPRWSQRARLHSRRRTSTTGEEITHKANGNGQRKNRTSTEHSMKATKNDRLRVALLSLRAIEQTGILNCSRFHESTDVIKRRVIGEQIQGHILWKP